MKDKIRPIYSELQGYLSQAPDREGTIGNESVWKPYHLVIDELSKITEKNYEKFRLNPLSGQFGISFVNSLEYRSKISGLISRLHAEYFSDERPPFSGMPDTIINQTQAQNQNQSMDMILNIQEKIISEIPKYKEGTKERNFLEKVKSALPSMKTATDTLSSILNIGSELGLHASDITKLLHF